MSINWREQKAAFLELRTFPHLQNMRVLIRTDNTTSMSYINKQVGTRSLTLMTLATTLWKWCLKRGISIQSNHVQGVSNQIADFEIRRPCQKNVWMIRRSIFRQMQHYWGLNDVSFCRSEYDTTEKVRIVASGSWQLRDGCSHPVLEAVLIYISQSSVESNHQMSPEIATRETTSSGYDNTILENSPLVSGSTNSDFRATYSTGPSDINSTSFTYFHMANQRKLESEARRVEILNTQYQHTTLNQEAQQILTQRTLSATITNRSYQRDQLLFLDWASDHNISDIDFSPIDLLNFLSR